MFGLLAHQGVGSIPWSPLAKGRLARPWGETTTRSENDPMGQRYVDEANAADRGRGRSGSPRRAGCRWRRSPWPGCCATRWSRPRSSGRPRSTTWPTRSRPLDLELTDDEVAELEAPYTPRQPSGYS